MASLLIKIKGIDRSAYLGNANERQIHFSSILGARGAAGFTLYLPQGLSTFSPQLATGQTVEIIDPRTDICVWAGTVDSFVDTVPGGNTYVTIDVTCASLEEILDRRMTQIDAFDIVGIPFPPGALTAGYIVTKLFNKYLVDEPITLGTVDDGVVFTNPYVTNYGTLASYFNDLASQSDYYWYVDPQTFQLHFLPRSSLVSAPFTISDTAVDILARPIREGNAGAGMSGGGLSREFSRTLTRQDFRDRQWIRLNYAAFAVRIDNFTSTGIPGAPYTLTKPVGQMVSVVESTSIAATGYIGFGVTGFGPGPVDGDTVTVGSDTYTFVSTLDNTQANQILIDGTPVTAAENFYEACNALASGSGITYSSPTAGNSSVVAEHPFTSGADGSTFVQVFFQTPGTVGNICPVASTDPGTLYWRGTPSFFAPAITTLVNGTSSTTTPTTPSIGQLNIDTGKNYYYRYGFTDITQDGSYAGAPAGATVTFSYYPIGADILGVQDDAVIAARAAAEGNSGIYEILTDASSLSNPDLGLVECQSLLDTFKTLPEIVYVEVRKAGLQVGQIATVAMLNPAINGTFLVNEIQGYTIPGDQYPRYQVELLSTARIGTWLQLWQLLATTGSSGASSGGGGSAGGNTTADTQVSINGTAVSY